MLASVGTSMIGILGKIHTTHTLCIYFRATFQRGQDSLTKAYGIFNVSPSFKKYDGCNRRKEVAIEVPPEIHSKGRTGKP
jgi:hypothetical protein